MLKDETEIMAAAMVAANTLAREMDGQTSVIVIVHRPGAPYVARVTKAPGTMVEQLATTLRMVANRAQDGVL